jgi:uncharacterized damage-inducible protein DinB
MDDLDEHGRPHPPHDADEVETLRGFLDHHRATLAWKCRGLGADGLAARTAATSMTLGGLLKHLALVEDAWFTRELHDRPMPGPWADVDWSADPDWEWHTAAADTPEELFALWEACCERSRASVAEALADGGIDRPAARRDADGHAPSLRWILVHMIEEYARHNGHADLLREAVDGEVGE